MDKILYTKMKYFTLLLLSLFIMGFYACDKDDDSAAIEESVTLENSAASLNIGEELVVMPKFQPDVVPQRIYSWVTSDPQIVGVNMGKSDYSVTLIAKKAGTAIITFSSVDEQVQATMEVTVLNDGSIEQPEDDGVLRVLAIGNSFSEDAIENYLYELAATEGTKMVIGNMFIGGASLELHLKNANEELAAYDFRTIDIEGTKTSTPNTTLQTAISSQPWDYISLQQVSGNSGQFSTFEASLPELLVM